MVRYDRGFFVIYLYVSPSEVSQKGLVSLEQLLNTTPLVGLGMLHAKGWLGFSQLLIRSSLPSGAMVNLQCLNESTFTCW